MAPLTRGLAVRQASGDGGSSGSANEQQQQQQQRRRVVHSLAELSTWERVLSFAQITWQWVVLLTVVPPLMVVATLANLPISVALWASGVLRLGRTLAARSDPVLAQMLAEVDSEWHGRSPLLAGLASLARCYVSLTMFSAHAIMQRVFVALTRPKVVFVVYTATNSLMKKFFCVSTAELLVRTGLVQAGMHPSEPWVFLLGLIYAGPGIGFGVYGSLLPCLNEVTREHLVKLPGQLRRAFPHAESIALAGRLPGIMTAAGVPVEAPIVDGLSGTVFAMEATIRALVERLPEEKRAAPSVAILGGGGYVGSRLVAVLAAGQPGSSKAATALHIGGSGGGGGGSGSSSARSGGVDVEIVLRNRTTGGGGGGGATTAVGAGQRWSRIIALDTRYAGERRDEGGVLYTAEAQDLSAADVVLVITRNGDDVAEYVRHATPGQQWGDDTHPEIGRALVEALRARGVHVHKAMATRMPPTALLPPLPGWPVAGTPGCLLMALVSARTACDWNGSGMGLAAGGKQAADDRYWPFSRITRDMGFRAMLTQHRRSKVDGVTKTL